MHRNVEIAKNVDNRFDGIFIKQRVGDVVIDFAVGDVAALFAQADQLDQFGAAVFRRLFSRPVAMLHGFHERLVTRSARLLGAARLFWRRFGLSFRRRRLCIRSTVFVSLFTDIFNRLDVFDLIEFGDVFIVGILIINNACDVFSAVVIKIEVFAVSVDGLCRFFASFALCSALGRLRFGRFRFRRLDWRRLSLLCRKFFGRSLGFHRFNLAYSDCFFSLSNCRRFRHRQGLFRRLRFFCRASLTDRLGLHIGNRGRRIQIIRIRLGNDLLG